jgi:hypothetical protein
MVFTDRGNAQPQHLTSASRTAIEKIREQNAKLKEELLLENKFSVRSSNQEAANLINKLQDDADVYTRIVGLHLHTCQSRPSTAKAMPCSHMHAAADYTQHQCINEPSHITLLCPTHRSNWSSARAS